MWAPRCQSSFGSRVQNFRGEVGGGRNPNNSSTKLTLLYTVNIYVYSFLQDSVTCSQHCSRLYTIYDLYNKCTFFIYTQ